MKKILTAIPATLLLLLPLAASAHEHDTFTINGKTYTFVVGSLNEPLVVDDKSGLDLTITKGSGMATMGPDGDMDGPPSASTPVTGLEDTLKVEMVAGDTKQPFDLSPQYGKPGAYETTFYPTVATTFSYHLTGTIDSTPVDLTFTCVPEGTPKAADDTTSLKLSDSVTRTLHSGAFGCPLPKEDLGFPEKAVTLVSAKNSTTSMWAIGFGLIGAILGLVAISRRRV